MMHGPTITRVEAIPVIVPGLRDFRISEGQTRTHVSVIVRLLTEEPGLEGIGEIVSAPPGKPEEFLEEIVGAIERYIAPALTGLAVHERNIAMERIDRALKGRHWTRAGVNNALFDLAGKALGVSVSHLLGGRRHSRIPVIGMVIGIMSPDEMARVAATEVAAGHDAIKIKIGERLDIDVARVAMVREAIGAQTQLRVDANDHYAPADAIRLIRAIERYAVAHVEQPVSRGDLLGLAEVQDKVGVPVMTDDAVATPEDAATVLRLKAAQRVKVKVTKHGLDGALVITRMLEAAGVPCVLGHVFEMGLAAVAEAHFAAVASNLVLPHEIGSLKPMGVHADLITHELRPHAGELTLPDGPGLGVSLDWEKISEWKADV